MNDERRLLYIAVDPETNDILHTRLFTTRTTQLTVLFLRELCDEQHVDGAPHLTAVLDRLGLRFRIRHHGNRNAVERIFKKIKCRTSSFSNTFSYAKPATAESWLHAWRSKKTMSS